MIHPYVFRHLVGALALSTLNPELARVDLAFASP